MCSTGGPTDIDLEMDEVESEKYKCYDCGGYFKGAGKKPVCPLCDSEKYTHGKYEYNKKVLTIR
jgi:rubrerythrin